MKQIYSFVVIIGLLAILSSCRTGGGGELTGVPQKNFRAEVPYGMVYIPGGSYLMGQTDQDVTFSQIAQTKQVTEAPFFMDQTEISNSQYRQFVNWVRDSIAITNYVNDDKYYIKPGKNSSPNPSGKKYINWAYVKKYPVMSPKGKGGTANASKLQGMYYQGDDRIFDRDEL